MKEGHFTELDGIRGVLATTVMLYHFGLNTFLDCVSGGWLQGGLWDLCVDFFFVLSGFVLAKSFRSHPPTLRSYAVKRWRRLAPVFVLTTGLILVLRPGHWDATTAA